jgi:hypothetical protein
MQRTGVRLVIGAVTFALAVVAAGIFLIAVRLVDPAQFSVGASVVDGWLAELATAPLGTRAAVCAGAPIAGLLLLGLTTRAVGGRGRGTMSMHVLDSDDRGFVVVDSRGIAIVAEEAAHTAPGVVDVEVEVRARSSRQVTLRLQIDVYPGANVKQAGNEARERARAAVEELVGVEVTEVSASTHVLEPDEMARVLM